MSDARVLLGGLVELGLIVPANTMISRQGAHDVADLAGGDARKALLILGVMTAHSFAEGWAWGAPSGAGRSSASSLPPRLRCTTFRRASPSASCSCSIRSCPSGSGWLAAGAMIWMVFAKLIPDALEDVSGPTVGVAVTLAFVALFAVWTFVLHA